jgi:hypothetical protein
VLVHSPSRLGGDLSPDDRGDSVKNQSRRWAGRRCRLWSLGRHSIVDDVDHGVPVFTLAVGGLTGLGDLGLQPERRVPDSEAERRKQVEG